MRVRIFPHFAELCEWAILPERAADDTVRDDETYHKISEVQNNIDSNGGMKVKMGKKLIALFLSVVMVMSLLPVAALAEGESEPATAAEDTGATVTVTPTITWSRTKELGYSATGLEGLYAGSKTDYESVSNSKGTITWDFADVSTALDRDDDVTGNDNVWDYGKDTQYTNNNIKDTGIVPVTGVSAATWNNRSYKAQTVTESSKSYTYELGQFDNGHASSYTVRKISGTFTWPKGYDQTSNIELVSKNDANYSAIYNYLEQPGNEELKAVFGGKKVIAVNDDMYVFIYKDGTTLDSDNYTDYLAFWTGTAGKGVWSWENSTQNWGDTWNQTEPATFNNEYALRAFHAIYPNMDTAQPSSSRDKLDDATLKKLNQSDNWYAFADGDAISTVLNSQYSAADFKGGETYHIDIYCFDTDKVGGMDELELKLTKAAPTEANVTVRYWLNSVCETTTAANFLGETTMTRQKIGELITLSTGTQVNQLNYKKADAIAKNSDRDVSDGVQVNKPFIVTADSDENIINVVYLPAGQKVVELYAGELEVPYDRNEHTVKSVRIEQEVEQKVGNTTEVVNKVFEVEDSVTNTSATLKDGTGNVVVNITATKAATLPGFYEVPFTETAFVKSISSENALGNYTVYQHTGKLTITYAPDPAVCTYDFGVVNSYNILDDVEKHAVSYSASVNNVTVDESGAVRYTPQSVNTGEEVTLTLTYEGGYTCEKKITFLPASNVLYEERFITNDGENGNWTVDGSAASTVVADNEDTVYGYTEAYEYFNGLSNDDALKATLNLNGGRVAYTKDKATFTFTGTGFDLISECGTDTGMLIVSVYDNDNKKAVKTYIVDTYFCGDEDIITGSGVLDYQVPVVRSMNLPYGNYTVSVMGYLSDGSGASVATKSKGLFSTQAASSRSTGVDTDAILRTVGLDEYIGCDVSVSFMDENSVLNGGTGPAVETTNTANSKLSGIFNWFKSLFSGRVSTQAAGESVGSSDISVYLDAFRVYQPLENETEYSENEKALKYGSFYDYIVGSALDVAEDIDGAMVYMEYDGDQDIAVIKEYKTQGPQNEVYLSAGNYVGFVLNGYEEDDTVMVSAKAVSGEAALGYYDSDCATETLKNALSATEMYYDVTEKVQVGEDDNGDTYYYLILGNIGEGVLSISGIKLPAAVTPGASEDLTAYTKPTESTTFDPAQFDVKCAASAKRGKNVVITAKTSLDVDHVAVFYDADLAEPVKEEVLPNNKKAVANGKATVYSFNVSVKIIEEGSNTFYVVAYDEAGVASAPVEVTITGK